MKKTDRILVIIPTYNEVENIEKLIPIVLGQYPTVEVLVVDDGSPDGTADAVEHMAKSTNRVHLLKRPGKAGLGKAYIEGFRFALERGFDFVFEMDADFSHDPNEMPALLKAMEHSDLAVGSRYSQGVTVIRWPMSRLLLSYFANKFTRFVTRLPLRDTTSGYKCFKRKVLESIDWKQIHSDGYAFQIEVNHKAWKLGYRLAEVPIIFVDRAVGQSKMSSGIISEALWMVWRLRIMSCLGRL
ncbi:polyprenol monophosphomannose synthase [bacterium]|nr:polyprenol monophosphomannose synthase [bacterium]